MRGAALVLLLLLSGCSGPSGPESASGTAASPDAAASFALPAWAVRDAWTYTVGDTERTYVVTGEQGGDWIMETDGAELAFMDLRSDISRLGPQRKSDLAGSQGSDRVEFFRWPLTDNKTWTTRWDDQPVTITVRLAERAAMLIAKDRNGTVAYRYTYDPAARWFKELVHYGPDGSELVTFTLKQAQRNWTGEVARWSVQEVANQRGDLASEPPSSATTFEVPLTATDVWASLTLVCTSGSVTGGVAPFPVVTTVAGVEPRGMGDGGTPCPVDVRQAGSAGAPRAPAQGGSTETWGWSMVGAPGSVGFYSIEVLVRTLTLAPVR